MCKKRQVPYTITAYLKMSNRNFTERKEDKKLSK